MTKITTKSDVYSFGVVLLEMITGRRPLDHSFGEGQSVVQWVRDHLCRKREPMEIIDARLQGRPDTQVQEMLQALGIALLCASPRPEDRPMMKDVAALLRGIQHDDSSIEARKAGGGGGRGRGRGRGEEVGRPEAAHFSDQIDGSRATSPGPGKFRVSEPAQEQGVK
jgi:serine/threonine protein kinase